MMAPFNRLYGATWWLHLINYLEPLVAPNSRLDGAKRNSAKKMITLIIKNIVYNEETPVLKIK